MVTWTFFYNIECLPVNFAASLECSIYPHAPGVKNLFYYSTGDYMYMYLIIRKKDNVFNVRHLCIYRKLAYN